MSSINYAVLLMLIFVGFRENLKSELLYQDMLVKELAVKTGISRHTLDNYLNVRENMPTADVAVKIAQALGVTVEYLITGEENQTEKSMPGTEIRALIQNFKLESPPKRGVKSNELRDKRKLAKITQERF